MDLTPDSPIEGYRLSPQQKNLWFLQQAAEGQPYRLFSAIQIEGDLKVPLLQQAVEQLVRRHEILRSTFVRPPGIKIAFQVIAEASDFSWSFLDLSSLDATEQQTKIAEEMAQHSGRHFDYVHGPMLALTLIQRSTSSHMLLITLPALCGDSTTLANFICELCRAYGNEFKQESPVQYADFSEWQYESLEANDEKATAGKNHWQSSQAAGVLTLALPFEKRTVQPQSFASDSIPIDFNSFMSRIEAFAHQQETSVSAVIFACWQALVWLLAGKTESEFVLDYLSTGRTSEELSDAFGLYAKYLPIISRCDDQSFIAHLGRVSNALKAADKWQEYFDPGQSMNIAGSVAYDFEERPPTYQVDGLSFSVIEQHARISPFKLKLSCASLGSALSANLQFDNQVFEPGTIKQFAAYFQRLVSSVLDNPQRHLADIEIIDDKERRQLLVDLNQTSTALEPKFVTTKGIQELFEAQATETPAALAVVHDDQQLTYNELNSRANQLAHLLRRRGVGPDVCIGLCVERSVEMIVGMLGILKAGGAYVPLNPDHPRERLAIQLAESKSSILITNGVTNQESISNAETIDLHRDRALLEAEPKHNPPTTTSLENLVYVIYTSGSTGIPKGVAVRHRNLINYTSFILGRLEVDRPLAFATVSTISADLGNTCIFPALLSGGCLHVIGYDASMDGNLLRDYFIKHRIDVLKIVPSHLSALLATQTDGRILPGRDLILGGEALTWDLVQSISQLDHSCRIINHYGPTETTVGSLTFNINEDTVLRYSRTVPIGRPIANTRCYILDQRQRPVPFGVSGELYIGGAGVASGYLNQPEQTVERFIRDPFTTNSNSRLYRTGDVARYLPDHNIEFLGRADHQVKVRGYRVELDEIEAVLSRVPGVYQTVVTLYRDPTGQDRIIAYLVSPRTSQDQISAALKQKLPDYMVPSVFVFLKSLPLTPNGKVDRAALPAPDDSRAALRTDFVAPRSSVEKELASIWAGLLKIDEVGVYDNFFELGGHSLLATQLVSRMRREFRMEIPLRSLFEAPTVAALAERIEKSTADNTARLLAELDRISDEEAARLLGLKKG